MGFRGPVRGPVEEFPRFSTTPSLSKKEGIMEIKRDTANDSHNVRLKKIDLRLNRIEEVFGVIATVIHESRESLDASVTELERQMAAAKDRFKEKGS